MNNKGILFFTILMLIGSSCLADDPVKSNPGQLLQSTPQQPSATQLPDSAPTSLSAINMVAGSNQLVSNDNVKPLEPATSLAPTIEAPESSPITNNTGQTESEPVNKLHTADAGAPQQKTIVQAPSTAGQVPLHNETPSPSSIAEVNIPSTTPVISTTPTAISSAVNNNISKAPPPSPVIPVEAPHNSATGVNSVNSSANNTNPDKAPILQLPHSISDKTTAAKKPIPGDNNRVVIATGQKIGVYFPIGGAMCRMVNRRKKDYHIRCIATPSRGSSDNINLLSLAEVDMALMQADIQKKVWENRQSVTGLANSRFMFSLYDEVFAVIVRKDSKIRKLEDMKPNMTSVGTKGYGVYPIMKLVMSAKGWTKTQLQSIKYIDFEDQAEALCSGVIDSMVVVVGHPNKIVEQASRMCEIRIIDLVDDQDIKNIIANYSEYSRAIIPAGIYAGVPEDVHSLGVRATVVATTGIDDQVAYDIVKSIFDDFDDFKMLHPILANLKKEEMVSLGQVMPMHEGSKRYFKEVGLLKTSSNMTVVDGNSTNVIASGTKPVAP